MHARFFTGGSLDTNEGSSPLSSSDDEVHIPRVWLVVGGVSLHILHGNIWVTIVYYFFQRKYEMGEISLSFATERN